MRSRLLVAYLRGIRAASVTYAKLTAPAGAGVALESCVEQAACHCTWAISGTKLAYPVRSLDPSSGGHMWLCSLGDDISRDFGSRDALGHYSRSWSLVIPSWLGYWCMCND